MSMSSARHASRPGSVVSRCGVSARTQPEAALSAARAASSRCLPPLWWVQGGHHAGRRQHDQRQVRRLWRQARRRRNCPAAWQQRRASAPQGPVAAAAAAERRYRERFFSGSQTGAGSGFPSFDHTPRSSNQQEALAGLSSMLAVVRRRRVISISPGMGRLRWRSTPTLAVCAPAVLPRTARAELPAAEHAAHVRQHSRQPRALQGHGLRTRGLAN